MSATPTVRVESGSATAAVVVNFIKKLNEMKRAEVAKS